MKIIGITGGIGAGKSAVSAELEKLGAGVIDADRISRQVSLSCGSAFSEIIECFGKGILTENGEIDRKKLGEIVFSDSEKLALLEKITHKHIFDEMKKQLDACNAEVAVLDVPLLFSSDFPFDCDVTVAVIAVVEVRVSRVMKRDNITRDAALLRIKNQLADGELKRLADVCFENNGDLDDLNAFAEKLYSELLKI